MGDPADAPAVAQRLVEGAAKEDGHVLRSMVGIYLKVPFGLHRQIEQAVASDRVEQMVEGTGAPPDLGVARPVDVHRDDDVRFASTSPELCSAGILTGHHLSSSRTSSNRSVCSGRPTEKRIEFSRRRLL